MSASYLLLKENKPETLSPSPSLNQTILKEDTNTSSTRSTLQTMELSLSIFLMLTLIFFSINVLFQLTELLLGHMKKRLHRYRSARKYNEVKENSTSSKTPQSLSDETKDHQ